MPAIDLQNSTVQQIIFIVISLWSLVWKGLALYKAGRHERKTWFILLLVVNTLGILEILYYFWLHKIDFSKLQDKITSLKNKLWRKK